MLIVGQDVDMIQKLKTKLSKTFDMKDLSKFWEIGNFNGKVYLGNGDSGR